MSFVSFAFAIFFVVFIFLFYAASYFKKNAVLFQRILILLASLVFYAWADLKFVPFLLYVTAISYFAGRLLEGDEKKSRLILAVLVALDLFPLLFFKYAPKAWHERVIFPLGLSFFTFQSLSYIFDCRSKKIQAEKNVLDVALFICFFPVISSGPIQRQLYV